MARNKLQQGNRDMWQYEWSNVTLIAPQDTILSFYPTLLKSLVAKLLVDTKHIPSEIFSKKTVLAMFMGIRAHQNSHMHVDYFGSVVFHGFPL